MYSLIVSSIIEKKRDYDVTTVNFFISNFLLFSTFCWKVE